MAGRGYLWILQGWLFRQKTTIKKNTNNNINHNNNRYVNNNKPPVVFLPPLPLLHTFPYTTYRAIHWNIHHWTSYRWSCISPPQTFGGLYLRVEGFLMWRNHHHLHLHLSHQLLIPKRRTEGYDDQKVIFLLRYFCSLWIIYCSPKSTRTIFLQMADS